MKFFHNFGAPVSLGDISLAFSLLVGKHGGTPASVLWKNSEGQQLRFEVLAGILDARPAAAAISVNDYGCGYGALFDFLRQLPEMPEFTYTGYDISHEMIRAAAARIDDRRASFLETPDVGSAADFTFVSGTFNLKLEIADKPWNTYVKSSLARLWSMSDKGLAFNMLDSGRSNKQPSLYYADAAEFMDYCSGLSSSVALIDDYPLDEWTILIRR